MVPDLTLYREHYTESEFKDLQSALQILVKMRFFDFAIDMNRLILLDSFDSDEPNELAGKILEARQTNRVLLAIKELAQPIEERK